MQHDRVRDWMTEPVISVDPDTPVDTARSLMLTNNVRHLPVVDDGRLVGVVSDRDLRILDPAEAVSLTANQRAVLAGRDRTVRTVMMTAVQTVWPHDTIVYAASVMAQWKIGGMPVVDADRVVGIVTTTDCLRALVALHHSDGPQG